MLIIDATEQAFSAERSMHPLKRMVIHTFDIIHRSQAFSKLQNYAISK